MTFGINHTGEKVFPRQINFALRSRQESISADGSDFAFDNSDSALDNAGRRYDQTVFKNNVRAGVGHKRFRKRFLLRFDACYPLAQKPATRNLRPSVAA